MHHWRRECYVKGVSLVGSDNISVMYAVLLIYLLQGRQQGHGHSCGCRRQLRGEVLKTLIGHTASWKLFHEELNIRSLMPSSLVGLVMKTCSPGVPFWIFMTSRLTFSKTSTPSLISHQKSLSKKSFQVDNNIIWKCALNCVNCSVHSLYCVVFFFFSEDWCIKPDVHQEVLKSQASWRVLKEQGKKG